MTTPAGGPPSGLFSRRARRTVFWLYAAALFVATHWPKLEIPPVVVPRPDIVIHAAAFCLWTGLLLATEYLGSPRRARTIAACFLAGVVWAALDEALQAVPGVNRTAAWDDWGADVLGVAVATVAAVIAAASAKRPTRVGDS